MLPQLSAGVRYFFAGHQAVKELPGLKSKVWKGFLLSLLLLFLLSGGLGTGIFFGIYLPLHGWLTGWLPGWTDWVVGGVAGLAGIALAIAGLVFSLRFTVILLGFFFEGAVDRIVEHFRPDTSPGKGGPSIIFEVTREVFFLVILIALQIIPAVGAIASAVFSSWLVGKGIHAPHRNVLMNRGLKRENPNHIACLSSGVSEMLLILVPFVGWFLLPWVMIHMVIGQAWLYESTRSTTNAESITAAEVIA